MTLNSDGSFKPTLSYRLVNATRSLGVFLIGLGVVITSLFVRQLYSDQQANQRESDCRSNIATELALVQADLNTVFVEAILLSFTHPRPDPANPQRLHPVVQAKVDELNAILTGPLPKARDRRAKISEICSR